MTTDATSTDETTIRAHVENAAERIGRVWPLYADVAANPIAGFEDRPFHRAVADAEATFGGRGYPTREQFERAWEDGRIDRDILEAELEKSGVTAPPERTLDRLGETDPGRVRHGDEELLNRLLSKWLAAFLDEGQAAWEMPNREDGFYAAWRELAPHDRDIPDQRRLVDLPETATLALSASLTHFDEGDWEDIFAYHLAALPGWTGRIKERQESEGEWQRTCPVTLTDYLAVRLILARHLECRITPPERDGEAPSEPPLAERWLTAWDETYRRRLVSDIEGEIEAGALDDGDDARPDAQLVFCIDTRSEVIRRHVEKQGNYETHGYAGFFGIPMAHSGFDDDSHTASCPVMVDPSYRVDDRPADDDAAERHGWWEDLKHESYETMTALKDDVAAAFGFVELAGGLFAPPMVARTLAPKAVYEFGERLRERFNRVEAFAEPTIERESHDESEALPTGMTLEQQVIVAEAAFDLMGIEEFAPLVVFAGHASQTVNNPYESSIDCGACSGSPGVPNARALAAVCNKPDVQERLRERGHEIPEDTVFLAGEHNTTTDEVTVFADDDVEAARAAELDALRSDLAAARVGATTERMRTLGFDVEDGPAETERRAADWAEPRPETGLAGNASFVIGPRELTEGLDLGGRAFLHSYDHGTDPDGEALANILTGPLVVTQMINAQYYFSAVDTGVYSSGSKITHNPVGHMGVLQGNGGDLMNGLPKQSLEGDEGELYHEPIRQTVVVHAPLEAVTKVIQHSETLTRFFDNGWMHLTVIDPTRENETYDYQGGLEWEPPWEARDVSAAVPSLSGDAEEGGKAPDVDTEGAVQRPGE